jgi:hypothetical protein
MLVEKYGLWISNGIKFDNKYEATLYATANHADIKFWYHDEIFENFNKSLLGKISINQLYKERAQQLRDSYDYLILYFSGGADSYNVLRSFIDNNIKLDEICVKWPKIMTDNKLYTPNSTNHLSSNIWSEWDYSVVPTLNYIKQYHPDINIVIKDYIPDTKNIDSIFEQNKHWAWSPATIKSTVTSNSEITMLSKGKTVGNIFGIDKPLLWLQDKRVYTYFTDLAMLTCSISNNNPFGSECFYWTPDMPLLWWEQVNQLFQFYNVNKEHQKFLFTVIKPGDISGPEKVRGQEETAKNLLYDKWDNRFQAHKKENRLGTNMYFWMFNLPELTLHKEKIIDNISQRSKIIAPSLLDFSGSVNNQKFNILKWHKSKFHYVGELD